MNQKVSTIWQSDMHFKAIVPPGIELDIDAEEKFGGTNNGAQPKALMLASLAGCTGLDVTSLLKKMRAEVKAFEIEVIANLTEEHPKYYDKVHIEYRFYDTKFKQSKIEKSVNLSFDRYCGVIEMFRQFAEVSFEIHYLEPKAS